MALGVPSATAYATPGGGQRRSAAAAAAGASQPPMLNPGGLLNGQGASAATASGARYAGQAAAAYSGGFGMSSGDNSSMGYVDPVPTPQMQPPPGMGPHPQSSPDPQAGGLLSDAAMNAQAWASPEAQRYMGQAAYYHNLGWTPGVGGQHPDAALQKWLEGALGLNFAQLDHQLGALEDQKGWGAALAQYQTGAAGKQLGITTGGINDDLKYGDLLRGEQGERNDLDLWRANKTWELLQAELSGKTETANAIWSELQQNNSANVGFAGRERDLGTWLNAANQGFNQETLDFTLRDNDLAAQRAQRQMASDATARSARSSRGYGLDARDEEQARLNANDTADLNFRQRDVALDTELGNINLSYDQTVEQLRHQLANGQISWQDALRQIANARAQGQMANQYAQGVYGINSDVLGIQNDQAASGAYWALQQAGLTHDNAVNGAGFDYQRLLLQLAQQGGSANLAALQAALGYQQYAMGYGG